MYRVRIAADISEGGAKAVDAGALTGLRWLLSEFLHWEPAVPGTAEGLATFLAPLARILRDHVNVALTREGSPLRSLANEWSGLLFPEGDDAQFADAYAQTVTYALLLARFEGAESLRPAMAVDALQRGHGLLAEALQLLEAPSRSGGVADAHPAPRTRHPGGGLSEAGAERETPGCTSTSSSWVHTTQGSGKIAASTSRP